MPRQAARRSRCACPSFPIAFARSWPRRSATGSIVAFACCQQTTSRREIPDGRVARISPLVPGIDLAGTVVESTASEPEIRVGAEVLVHGYELGQSHHGGFAELARVPAGWVVPLPDGLDAKEAMVIGTAGFTAALSITCLEERGLQPRHGPVIVTGATGGVGRTAVELLARRGYEVWASTGKADARDELLALGAREIVPREEVIAESSKPLDHERWAAAVVFPFILRGVALLGIDSAWIPIDERRRFWARLADRADLRPSRLANAVQEVTLDTLEPALDALLAGRARGRWIVRIGATRP